MMHHSGKPARLLVVVPSVVVSAGAVATAPTFQHCNIRLNYYGSMEFPEFVPAKTLRARVRLKTRLVMVPVPGVSYELALERKLRSHRCHQFAVMAPSLWMMFFAALLLIPVA
eukprot:scaffold4717_cov53-Attheya_sp.AAC.2